MKPSDYATVLLVDQTPEQAFNAINNVSAWWSEDFEGHLGKLNDEFTVRFGDVYITSKVIELTPGRKIVWLVTDCKKPWLKNTKEWVGTKMRWALSSRDSKTQISFTHLGLVPEIECFDACQNAWTEYLHQSLRGLIAMAKGKPTRKQSKVKPSA